MSSDHRFINRRAFTRGWQIVLGIFLSAGLHAQIKPSVISGIIKDETGAALPGITVKLQKDDFSVSSQSDHNGIFFFNDIMPSKQYQLVFTAVGFENQTISNYEVITGELSSIAVVLKRHAIELSPVVVIGYGTVEARAITNAVSSLNPSQLNTGVITNTAQLLQGKVAGLNITADGNPNGVPSIILRGPSTLNLGQQPFYVIDGVAGADINLISPDDIGSVEVLKDASATAIYGNRAANGVIIITPKTGKPGEPRLSYKGYTTVQMISNLIDVASASELRSYLKANNRALAPADDDGANTNWQKVVSRIGFAQNHNISFSNGGDGFIYSGSLNYFRDDAIIKGSSLERFVGRISIEQKAAGNRVKFKFSLYDKLSKQTDVDTLVFYNVLRFLPTVKVFNADGTYKEDLTRTQTYNPAALIGNNQFNTGLNTVLINGGIEAKLPFSLTYNVNVNYQSTATNSNSYFNHYSLLAPNQNGEAIRSAYNNTKKIAESFLSFQPDLSKGNALKLLLGYSWQEDTNGDGFQTSNVNFASDATSYYNLSLGQAPAGYVPLYGTISLETLRLISFFSRINYNYKNKYIFQASIRRDGSSAFGADHRWGYFPAVSAAWRIIEEKFMTHQTALSDLKFRIGYGVAGNTIGFDPLTPLLINNTTGSFYYNGSFVTAIGPVQNPNPNLRWEKTAQLDAGLDFAFFNNRLSGTIDVYKKTTTDLIYSYQEPVSLSYTSANSITANAGEMSNKGIELSLSGRPVATGTFNWNTSFNIAHNKNNVISLSNSVYKLNYIFTAYPSGTGQSNISTQILKAGYPVGQFFTLHYLGQNSNGVSMFEDKNGQPTLSPKSTDQRYLGNAQPELLFGFTNSFRYKQFDLSFFLRGVTGNKILNATLATLNAPGDASNHNVPKLTLKESYNDYNASLYSDRYLESGSYLRLDNASLGYALKFASGPVKSVKCYITGTNLFTITGYSGIDPEINIGSITPGIDNHNYYPKTRAFILGVNLEL